MLLDVPSRQPLLNQIGKCGIAVTEVRDHDWKLEKTLVPVSLH
jgi:hypothetical protein